MMPPKNSNVEVALVGACALHFEPNAKLWRPVFAKAAETKSLFSRVL